MNHPASLVLLFAACCALSTSVTWWLLRKKLSFGSDLPDQLRKDHGVAIPRVGGLPLFLTLAAGVLFLLATGTIDFSKWWPLLLCNALIFGIGFVDDLRPLGAKIKLLGQIGVALLAFSLELSIEVVSIPFGDGDVHLDALSLPITLFWCVAITNIVNLIDGMDGLASGLGMFLCICLGIVGFVGGQMGVALLAIIMAGGLLGFLVFNLPPAKIFLGDGGAYLLGFFIASLSMHSSHKGTVAAALLVVMIALGLPILDTLFAILRRGIRGVPLFRGDSEHIHHRLLGLGYSKNSALLVMYGVCAILSVIALSVFLSKGFTLPIAGAAIVLFALFAARYLGYVSDWKKLRQQIGNALNRRKEVQYSLLHGQLLEAEIDRATCSEEYWSWFDDALKRQGLSLEPTEGMEPVAVTYNHGRSAWTIHTPAGERTPQDWIAIGECLLPAYLGGIEKWGSPPSQ